MMNFIRCIFSPRLYCIYRDTSNVCYQPRALESLGNKMITATKLGFYTCPFVFTYIYYGGSKSLSMVSFVGGLVCFITLAYTMRAIGRYRNRKYMQFLNTYSNAMKMIPANMQLIRLYDFELKAWPVSFQMPRKRTNAVYECYCNIGTAIGNIAKGEMSLSTALMKVLAFFGVHIFGLRMIYPGCLPIVRLLVWNHLLDGRRLLFECQNAKRARIVTADGNSIDTMFVPHEHRHQRGDTLVICCEGNSGFYEIGICGTPIKAGYSVLGWNRPGFGESSGLPYPSQEQNAMDAVMQYAINDLGFKPENIVLLGWSIGGYTASWAACNYPIKALVLDATFDDLLPLAQNHMPKALGSFVKELVRSHVNLDIATMLKKYDGPVKLIRRTEDEMICLRTGDMSTNRGNDLLYSILTTRYPETFEHDDRTFFTLVSLREQRRRILQLATSGAPPKTREILSLISKYMYDYESTHSTLVPEDIFVSIMQNINENVPLN